VCFISGHAGSTARAVAHHFDVDPAMPCILGHQFEHTYPVPITQMLAHQR
jgi:hypothetical protein